MAARQVRVLAGSASALATVALALAGCAAAGHPAAATMPRPASQKAAAGQAGPHTAANAARLASPLLKCADPVAPGHALGSAGGVRAAAQGGTASPIPLATAGRVTLRQLGVVNLSQPGLVVLCGPATAHCPPGFRKFYLGTRPPGRRPRLSLPYPAICVARFHGHPLPSEPPLTPVPLRTRPLHTMPPQPAGT
jgi:hypothetical protein